MGKETRISFWILMIWLGFSGKATWADPCGSVPFQPIMCEDFDQYCQPAPVAPATCAPEAVPDNDTFRSVWAAANSCSGLSAPDSLYAGPEAKGAFSARAIQEGDGWDNPIGYDGLQRHVRTLTPDILAHPANILQRDAINGAGEISDPLTGVTVPSDYVDSMSRELRPQALKATFYIRPLVQGASASFANMIFYHELCLGDDHAPIDFTTQDCNFYHDCNCDGHGCLPGQTPTCDGGTHDGETCSDDSQCYGGPIRPVPKATDGTIHASFAVGLMAIMDTSFNPCDLDQGWYPSNWRMVVFDGESWHQFQGPKFELPSNPPDLMDLMPLYGWNWVDLAIGADYVEVRLTNLRSEALHSGDAVCVFHSCTGGPLNKWYCDTDADCPDGGSLLPNNYFVARVPRKYKGPFDRYALGPATGRNVNNPQLPGPPECLEPYAEDDVLSDEIMLYDGVFQPRLPQGACCMSDGTCSDTDQANCTTLQGQWHDDQDCATALCCPHLWPDADRDQDVDQADFATFQRCLAISAGTTTSACRCFDRNGDALIDANDFQSFVDCATGPAIPWSAQIAPQCVP